MIGFRGGRVRGRAWGGGAVRESSTGSRAGRLAAVPAVVIALWVVAGAGVFVGVALLRRHAEIDAVLAESVVGHGRGWGGDGGCDWGRGCGVLSPDRLSY
ncbi:hypothetical protein GCM10020358_00290 [Amorphoplanes nipponensis]|uniref:Uncharacterized protein n=1 Tax=Actinoplanes nipponensis TaxID=135950 RepID=A0A919JJ34_9ACTN|nr:hypothetical protein Ani05nite_50100 [Actinoplanes nipponensis]